MLKSNESVKFILEFRHYTVFHPFYQYPPLLYAGKMKYWDKNKGQKFYYQNEKETPGRKRDVGLKEEFNYYVLLRLKLGLLERHLANMFTVSVIIVTRIYTTKVRFLALTFN